VARFLANTYFGMQTVAKLGLSPSVFDDVVEETLEALG
jgi:hypothetical protein